MSARRMVIPFLIPLGIFAGCSPGQDRPAEPASAVEPEPLVDPAASTPIVDESAAAAAVTTDARAAACAAITDWRDERIPMPPDWAPDLPKGYELLRFAPGMYKPDQDDYFSYAFTLMWDQPQAIDRARLTEIVEHYYRGLIKAVSASKNLELPADYVSVTVTGEAPSFQVTVTMIEPFVTGDEIALQMDIRLGDQCLGAKASPKDRSHPVWRSLDTAAACLPCP